MMTYCVKYRKDTENLDSKIFETKNVRSIMQPNVLNADLKSQDLWKNKKQKIHWVIRN